MQKWQKRDRSRHYGKTMKPRFMAACRFRLEKRFQKARAIVTDMEKLLFSVMCEFLQFSRRKVFLLSFAARCKTTYL